MSLMRVSVAFLLLLGLAGCVSAAPPYSRATQRGTCGDFELDVHKVWSSSQKQQVHLGIISLGSEVFQETALHIETKMDELTRSWVMTQESICKDAVVRGAMPLETYNRMSVCLLTAFISARTLIASLSASSAPSVKAVMNAKEVLTKATEDLNGCQNAAVLAGYDDPVQDGAARLAREALAEARVLAQLGDLKQYSAAVDRARTQASETNSRHLKIDVQLEEASRTLLRAQYAETERLANAALQSASLLRYELARATAFTWLGLAANGRSQYDKAIEYHLQALEIRERELGRDQPLTGTCYNNIGLAYAGKSKYEEAIRWYTRAMAVWERSNPPARSEAAATYHNMASAYREVGDYVKSLELLDQARHSWATSNYQNHPDAATTYNDIGVTYQDAGDYDLAMRWYAKALQARERVFGRWHPDVAETQMNIGTLFVSRSDYRRALEHTQIAVEVFEKTLGPEHLRTSTAYNNLGTIYSALADEPRALEMLDRARVILERDLGRSHPRTAETYNNIGISHENMKDHDAALMWYQRARGIWEHAFGAQHPSTVAAYNNIGATYASKGSYDLSLVWYRKACEAWQRLGTSHERMTTCYLNLADTTYHQHKFEEAVVWYGKALVSAESHKDLFAAGLALHGIGVTRETQHAYAEAFGSYTRALQLFDKVVGRDHPQAQRTVSYIADVCRAGYRPACSVP